MKLNHDCIRDLLLYIENNASYNEEIKINNLSLKKYSNEELIYTADKLIEAKYLNCIRYVQYAKNMPFIAVKSITFEGHKFLDNIRDNNVWEKTKNILSKFSSTSIGIVSNISAQVISNIISKQLNLL